LVCPIGEGYNRFMDKSIRAPIAAGAFYPKNPDVLRAAIESLYGNGIPRADSDRPSIASVGLIAPHAGYLYSGRVAAAGYERAAALGCPEAVLLLGANHTGLGAPVSLSGHAIWETPLGRTPVDARLVEQLADTGLPVSDAAFEREHSIEVQLPLVQSIWGFDLPIVPVCVTSVPFPPVRKTAEALAKAVRGRRCLVVASSDFTHYEPDVAARGLDRLALEPIRALDVDGFTRIFQERGLSICGAGAIAVLLELCLQLKLTNAELVEYATSGDVTGDRGAVVGYASVLFTTEGS